jgi:chromosomal replication initiation ATPase DnaA
MRVTQMQAVVNDTEKRLTALLGTKVTVNVSFDVEASHIKNDLVLLEHLKMLVCQEFKTTWDEIISDRMFRSLVDARSVYCFLVAKYFRSTHNEIARDIKRHRTSVLHLMGRLQGFIDVNDPIVRNIQNIENIFSKLL